MLDMKLIREHSDLIKANYIRRKCPINIDSLLELDADYRKLGQEAEAMRAERNKLSKQCGTDPAAREQVKSIKISLGEKEAKMAELEKKIKPQLAKMKESKVIIIQNGALIIDSQVDELISSIPSRVPEK